MNIFKLTVSSLILALFVITSGCSDEIDDALTYSSVPCDECRQAVDNLRSGVNDLTWCGSVYFFHHTDTVIQACGLTEVHRKYLLGACIESCHYDNEFISLEGCFTSGVQDRLEVSNIPISYVFDLMQMNYEIRVFDPNNELIMQSSSNSAGIVEYAQPLREGDELRFNVYREDGPDSWTRLMEETMTFTFERSTAEEDVWWTGGEWSTTRQVGLDSVPGGYELNFNFW